MSKPPKWEKDVPKLLAALDRLFIAHPIREHVFHDSRGWRFDFAWPGRKLALEVEDGAFMQGGGRHTRGAGFRDDLEKYNEAVAYGWRILRIMPEQVKRSQTADLVRRAWENLR